MTGYPEPTENDSAPLVVGAGAQAKLAVEILVAAGNPPSAVVDVLGGLNPSRSWTSRYQVNLIKLGEAIALSPRPFLAAHAVPDEKSSLVDRFEERGFTLTKAISQSAHLASTSSIDSGAIIGPGVVVETFASVGRCFVARGNAVVEHDCQIGNFVTLAPGATLAGWVHLNDNCTVHTNATIVPSVHVGKGAIVGAGSVVLGNVGAQQKVVGVPARPI